MKRILFILLLLISIQGYSQTGFYGYITNNSYRGIGATQKAYLPADTFAVTGTLKNYKWIAIKSGEIWLWQQSQNKWVVISGGGGTTYTYTLPLLNTSTVISIKGLSGVGSAGQVPISQGSSGWTYHYPFNHDSAILYSFETKGLAYIVDGGANLDTLTVDISNGTYTPTLTNISNVASSSIQITRYSRIGDDVTVSGAILLTPTTGGTTNTQFRINPPIASNFTTAYQASGVMTRASGSASYEPGTISSDATTDQIVFTFVATDSSPASRIITFTYKYTIL